MADEVTKARAKIDEARNVKGLIDDQQYLLDRANADLAEFDSQPAMVNYEAQRQQIYKQALADRDSALRRLDAQHNELLKARNDLLAQRIRDELDLKDLKARYQMLNGKDVTQFDADIKELEAEYVGLSNRSDELRLNYEKRRSAAKCRNCGAPTRGKKFCTTCGSPLTCGSETD